MPHSAVELTVQVLKVSGVLVAGRPQSVYAVLFGAARCVRDFSQSSKKVPNCEWALDVAAGPSKGRSIKPFAAQVSIFSTHSELVNLTKPRLHEP